MSIPPNEETTQTEGESSKTESVNQGPKVTHAPYSQRGTATSNLETTQTEGESSKTESVMGPPTVMYASYPYTEKDPQVENPYAPYSQRGAETSNLETTQTEGESSKTESVNRGPAVTHAPYRGKSYFSLQGPQNLPQTSNSVNHGQGPSVTDAE